jgi:hypothetical protein
MELHKKSKTLAASKEYFRRARKHRDVTSQTHHARKLNQKQREQAQLGLFFRARQAIQNEKFIAVLGAENGADNFLARRLAYLPPAQRS